MRWTGLLIVGVISLGSACSTLKSQLRVNSPLPDPSLKVSYRLNIEPILRRACDCHDEIRRTRDLDFTRYRTGRYHRLVVPFKPEQSMLYLRLTGELLPREPYLREPLPEYEIALFRMWIEQGALFATQRELKSVVITPHEQAFKAVGSSVALKATGIFFGAQ